MFTTDSTFRSLWDLNYYYYDYCLLLKLEYAFKIKVQIRLIFFCVSMWLLIWCWTVWFLVFALCSNALMLQGAPCPRTTGPPGTTWDHQGPLKPSGGFLLHHTRSKKYLSRELQWTLFHFFVFLLRSSRKPKCCFYTVRNKNRKTKNKMMMMMMMKKWMNILFDDILLGVCWRAEDIIVSVAFLVLWCCGCCVEGQIWGHCSCCMSRWTCC